MTGIPTSCAICNAALLNPHEITGLCQECKLVLRNERMRGHGEPELAADAQDIAASLTQRCSLCGAPPGNACRNTVRPGQPLPGRQVHHYRIPIQKGTSA
ncbi:hypothetical protein C3477_13255 [Mycobacterium kansasii]|uniref:zinc finger domain-containing protein n=1 Tax=Mycobacterium kansasii TaxID=1768 RepID=UPI000CDCE668|nr:hypothetical protein [Mycobacterium kansasii]POX86873.1 hypothetical protein C3B43_19060 [Mycobacterium kansasii]POY05595.1 hypothetical protein C3477_13255 [Mycobacterium kansasii]POY16915.1 hypothetical protein C3476_21810 [Mycobacterium kansasii]